MNARLSSRSPASAFTPRLNGAQAARLAALPPVSDGHLLRREPVVIGVVCADGQCALLSAVSAVSATFRVVEEMTVSASLSITLAELGSRHAKSMLRQGKIIDGSGAARLRRCPVQTSHLLPKSL